MPNRNNFGVSALRQVVQIAEYSPLSRTSFFSHTPLPTSTDPNVLDLQKARGILRGEGRALTTEPARNGTPGLLAWSCLSCSPGLPCVGGTQGHSPCALARPAPPPARRPPIILQGNQKAGRFGRAGEGNYLLFICICHLASGAESSVALFASELGYTV